MLHEVSHHMFVNNEKIENSREINSIFKKLNGNSRTEKDNI